MRRELTLSYTNPKDGKTQTFVGVLAEGYSIDLKKDGNLHELKPSELKLGGFFKVYYLPSTRKIEGKKKTVNTIFLISRYPDARPHYYHFKAFLNE